MTIQSTNPATEEIIAVYEETSPADVEAALATAADAFRSWRRTSFADRATLMRRAAACLRERKSEYAMLMTSEMGKPIVEAEAEVEKCAWTCDYFAEHAEAFLRPDEIASSAQQSYVEFEPLGPILAIMPWNFPFWQVFRFAAPTLMAGNVAVLKHASNVPGCALAIEAVFRGSGFPAGVFRTLIVSGAGAEALIGDDRIRAVTLTGGDAAGRSVATAAGRHVKKSVLELGGSDPYVVLADADLELAATTAVRARFQNAGQSCIAAKRFVIVDAVADEFERRLVDEVARLRVGDPLDHATQVGPLARADLRVTLERQVGESIRAGGKVVFGGNRRPGTGYFFEPTVITDVTSSMPVFREETFGPVAIVIRVPDAETAVAVANDTPYGLGASLWTRDLARARTFAQQIEAGSVFVNGMVASDPRLPFGGIKQSGYGRELSAYGIKEFVNIKTLVLSDSSGASVQHTAE